MESFTKQMVRQTQNGITTGHEATTIHMAFLDENMAPQRKDKGPEAASSADTAALRIYITARPL